MCKSYYFYFGVFSVREYGIEDENFFIVKERIIFLSIYVVLLKGKE